MIDPSKLYLFIFAAIALLLVPGPAVLYITARSANQGRTAGLVSGQPPDQPRAARRAAEGDGIFPDEGGRGKRQGEG